MSANLDEILKFTLSGLRIGEEPKIISLIAACGLPTEDLSPGKLRHFVVARKGDHPIGVIGVELIGDRSILRSLAVSEPYRNQGLAKKLVVSLERYALSHKITTLYLLTATAVEFFSRHGYTKIERSAVPPEIQATQEFKTLCPDTAVCMTKALSI